jgi:hypothetical protein
MTAVDRLGRAWDLYRRTASSRSAILLLLANLIPLAGVLFFDWSLLTILVLYWLENGIVGVWNVPKIILAQGSLVTPARAPGAPAAGGLLGPQARARLAVIPRTALAIFFSFHYGMFWLVHGIFVFSLPAFAGAGGGPLDAGPCFDPTGFPEECAGGAFGALAWPSVLIGGVALFVSHGASFFLNYLGRGEHRSASPSGQMGSVYGRVVVLHLTIILGSMVVAFLGSPVGALIVLVVLKTLFDLNLHLRERRRAGTPATPGPGNATQAAPRSDNLQPEQP